MNFEILSANWCPVGLGLIVWSHYTWWHQVISPGEMPCGTRWCDVYPHTENGERNSRTDHHDEQTRSDEEVVPGKRKSVTRCIQAENRTIIWTLHSWTNHKRCSNHIILLGMLLYVFRCYGRLPEICVCFVVWWIFLSTWYLQLTHFGHCDF